MLTAGLNNLKGGLDSTTLKVFLNPNDSMISLRGHGKMQISVGINKQGATGTVMYCYLNISVLRAKILYKISTDLAHYSLLLPWFAFNM